MERLIRYCIDHPLLVNLATLFVYAAGVLAFLHLNRDAFPNVSYDRMTVITAYPGADPESVERLITIPLEREIKEVSDIKEVRSVSVEGRSVILIELEPQARNKDRLMNEVQRAIDKADDLPLDLPEKPRVTEVRSRDRPIIEVALSGSVPEERLVQHAKILERKILDLEEVSSVVRQGWREKEIWVEVNPETLAEYYFSLADVIAVLQRENVNIPGGVLQPDGQEWLLRSSGEFASAEDVGRVVLRANDARHWVQIRDVSNVRETFAEEILLQRTNGTRGIHLVVLKKEKGDAIDLVEEIKKLVAGYEKGVSEDLHLSLVNDFSFYIRRRLNVLYTNGIFGFGLVCLCLILFMNARAAFMTAVGIPFSLLVTFCVMQLSGMSLNLLTMFGLITVLGMLVDDAIVISENVYRLWKGGMPLQEACLKGTLEVWKPVASSVFTTIVAFLPLMAITGIIGKYVKFIPLMVIIALLASLAEAYFVLPSHLCSWLKESRIQNHRAKGWMEKWTLWYLAKLRVFLRMRYRVAAGLGAFFLFGLWLYFHLPFILFPARGIETFFIRAQSPVGTSLEETARRFEALEKVVAGLPKEELKDFVLQVGIQQNDSHDPFTERFSHLGQIQVFLTPPADRDREAEEIVASLRGTVGQVPGLSKPEFELMRPGPPLGKPVAVRVQGDDLGLVRRLAGEISGELKKIGGVKDVKLDEEKGKEEMVLRVDPVRLAQAGLGLQDVGLALRAGFEGIVATTIKKSDEEIDIRVRFPKVSQKDQKNLDAVLISNGRGDVVPLGRLANFEEKEGISAIRHLDRDRTITVLANLEEEKTNILDVQARMQPFLDGLSRSHAEIHTEFGGEFEDTRDALAGLGQAFLLGAFLIFILLAVQFNSLWQPLVVMSSIPLGLIGVLFAFWVHGEPKSFLGLMGMVGLAGVVVNNAIVLVDFINEARKRGVEEMESILQACQLRLRPVLLTSVTTVLGLISLAYGFWGSDPFLKPMALAFVWGLAFATVLTLIAVPCFHAIADDFITALRRRSPR